MSLDSRTLGRARFDFAKSTDIDLFVEKLEKFERGELGADEWRAFRLANGTYGQRQLGELSMLRAKAPQGILTAEQLEAVASVASRYSRGFAHITTRQNFQFHFVRLPEMERAMRDLAAVGITTREACGNTVRNVTASPTAGVAADEVFDPIPYAEAFTRHFLRHPLSGSLPRKFKVAFSGGGSDHAFILVNDLGFSARLRTTDRGIERGFRLTVAGGTAILCRSGEPLFEFIPAAEILGASEAVLRVFDAHGERVHRHKNRLKFLVKQFGWEKFRALVLEEFEKARAAGLPPLPFDPENPPDVETAPVERSAPPSIAELASIAATDSMRGPGIVPRFLPTVGDDRGERFTRTNVKPQRQEGYVSVTVTVPLGDLSSGRLRALAALSRSYGDGTVRTTHGQNLVLRWVKDTDVPELYSRLRAIGLSDPDPESIADVSSCPGAETCKLAVTHSRGAADELSSRFRLDRDLVDRAKGLVVKISGCPNGCGLHHVAGLGFQGGMRKVDNRPVPQYFVLVGGEAGGDTARFGRVAAKVPARRVGEVFERLVKLYESKRQGEESITTYLGRAPLLEIKASLADLEPLDAKTATPEDYIDLGETVAFAPETSEGECAA
ncbi:nitrite/sulfite reductase [Labilithrix luteola]|uniref:nitrite/sulfite reductase n=1 Tax=Labilithrix luteola TaxID=1391654 RepID=UPI000A975748|nr:nitrite/sulfite reductase [Labilithrix luteola]